jgi:hypothetical protein
MFGRQIAPDRQDESVATRATTRLGGAPTPAKRPRGFPLPRADAEVPCLRLVTLWAGDTSHDIGT